MKDAFGGLLNIFLIVLFLTIVMGILGLVVSYTKAFKMKNFVISRIEQYEGRSCFKTSSAGSTACYDKIVEDAKSIGFSPVSVPNCPSGYTNVDNLFCYAVFDDGKKTYKRKNADNFTEITDCKIHHYAITTQIDINFPIINKIMGMKFFQINGSSRIINDHNCVTSRVK